MTEDHTLIDFQVILNTTHC